MGCVLCVCVGVGLVGCVTVEDPQTYVRTNGQTTSEMLDFGKLGPSSNKVDGVV